MYKNIIIHRELFLHGLQRYIPIRKDTQKMTEEYDLMEQRNEKCYLETVG